MQPPAYLGTPEHQRLLRAIAEQYGADPRVLAVSVFGSLGRGTWDARSDLDLDVVIAEGVALNPIEEARHLCAALGEEAVVILPDRDDAVDIVLASLKQLSIRYHPLHNTSPNIVESLVVLAGRLDHDAIVAAGLANRRPPPSGADLVGACVRLAVTVDTHLHRQRFWTAYLVLHEMREQMLRLFAVSHGAVRPYHAFEAADPSLKVRIGKTLPRDTLPSVQQAFLGLLDVMEQDIGALSDGQASLTELQRRVIAELRARYHPAHTEPRC